MLTIKEPIKLNSLRSMGTIPDALGRKLTANYTLMTAQITPQDLLFLLTAPPEVLMGDGDTTNISLLHNTQATQTVTLDVVNNVVNRILMADHSTFTYQDQVYITSILQKLGITNPAEFMKQVKLLQETGRDTQTLLALYRENETTLRDMVKAQEDQEKPDGTVLVTEEGAAAPEDRVYLHNEIYSRLHTSGIYETMQSFQYHPALEARELHTHQLRLAEQARASRLMTLSQTKERILGPRQVDMQYYINAYEQGVPHMPLETEAQILSAGAAGALLNLVDQVMVAHTEITQSKEDIWLDLSKAVSQTAENSVLRFEAYHSDAQTRQETDARVYEALHMLRQEEITAISQLRQLIHREAEEGKKAAVLWQEKGPEESERLVWDDDGEEAAVAASPKEALIQLKDSDLTVSQTEVSALTKVVINALRRETAKRRERAQKQWLLQEQARDRARLEHPEEEEALSPEAQARSLEETRAALRGQREDPLEQAIWPRASEDTPHDQMMPSPDPVELTGEYITKVLQEKTVLHKDEVGRLHWEAIRRSRGRPRKDAELTHPPKPEGEAAQAPAEEQGAAGQTLSGTEMELLAGQVLTHLHSHREKSVWLQRDTVLPGAKERETRETERMFSQRSLEYAKRLERINELQTQMFRQEHSHSQARDGARQMTQVLMQQWMQESRRIFDQLQQVSLERTDVTDHQETLIHQHKEEQTEQTQILQEMAEETYNETEVLQQQLDMINQRNLKIYQQLQESGQQPRPRPGAVPDQKRIFSDAMRAIEHPEQVLMELMETPAPMDHRQIPPDMEAAFAQMDDVSRTVYEALLQYERDPQGAIAAGLVQRGDTGQLEAQIQAVEREQEQMTLTHQIQSQAFEQQIVKETAETVIEQWIDRKAPLGAPPREDRPKVPIVHKRQESQVSEELLERLEQQRKEETRNVVTEQVVTKENVVQKEVVQETRERVAQSAEDITEIINRSLARQIGAISDRVYGQLERKLQMERARRGRF